MYYISSSTIDISLASLLCDSEVDSSALCFVDGSSSARIVSRPDSSRFTKELIHLDGFEFVDAAIVVYVYGLLFGLVILEIYIVPIDFCKMTAGIAPFRHVPCVCLRTDNPQVRCNINSDARCWRTRYLSL